MQVSSLNPRIFNVLQKSLVFGQLSRDQIEKVLGFCQIRKFSAEEILSEKGVNASEFYIILKGKIRVEDNGNELAVIEPINLIGETGFFLGLPRSASIISSEESTVLTISRDNLAKVLENDFFLENKMLDNLLSSLIEKLQISNLTLNGLLETIPIAPEYLDTIIEKKDEDIFKGFVDKNKDLSHDDREFLRYRFEMSDKGRIFLPDCSMLPITDVSAGGFCVEDHVNFFQEMGRSYEIKLLLNHMAPIDAEVKSVWKLKKRCGLEFLKIKPRDRYTILLFCREFGDLDHE